MTSVRAQLHPQSPTGISSVEGWAEHSYDEMSLRLQDAERAMHTQTMFKSLPKIHGSSRSQSVEPRGARQVMRPRSLPMLSEPEPEPEPEPELAPRPRDHSEPEGTIAVLLRHGPGWLAPRSPSKCRGKLQAAQLRLLLCFLQHERLAEHCPVALEEWGMLETIGGCFAALDGKEKREAAKAARAALSARARKALDDQLYDAADKGDAAAIERLVAQGASFNVKNEYSTGSRRCGGQLTMDMRARCRRWCGWGPTPTRGTAPP